MEKFSWGRILADLAAGVAGAITVPYLFSAELWNPAWWFFIIVGFVAGVGLADTVVFWKRD